MQNNMVKWFKDCNVLHSPLYFELNPSLTKLAACNITRVSNHLQTPAIKVAKSNFKILNFEALSLKSEFGILYFIFRPTAGSSTNWSAYQKPQHEWECVVPANQLPYATASNKRAARKWTEYLFSLCLFIYFLLLAILTERGHKHLSALYMTCRLFWIPVKALMGPEQNGAISLSEAVNTLITESLSAILACWQECRYFLCLFLSVFLSHPLHTHLHHSSFTPSLFGMDRKQGNSYFLCSEKKITKDVLCIRKSQSQWHCLELLIVFCRL